MFKKANFAIRSLFTRQTQEFNSNEKTLKKAQDFESLYAGFGHVDCMGTISLSQVKEAIAAANSGNPSDLVYILDEVLELDGVIAAHLQTRTFVIAGKNWSVTSERYPQYAKEANNMLLQLDMNALISTLLQAVVYGYAGVVLDWENGGGKLNGFEPIHPACFDFTQRPYVCLIDSLGERHLIDHFAPHQFLFTRYKHHANVPSSDGIGRTLLWLYIMKKRGLESWNRFIDKFGVPMLLGKLPEGASSEQARALLRSLLKMTKEGVGVSIGADAGLETLEASKSADDHERYCRYIDELMTLSVLGQLASSDRSSGTSNGNVQGAVRYDIMMSDVRFVMQAIQKSIINPWLKMRYNLDSHEHDLLFWIDCEPQKEIAAYADMCAKLANATGCTLDKTWVENEFNIKLQGVSDTLSSDNRQN